MISILTLCLAPFIQDPNPADEFWVRPGYEVEVASEPIANARFMEFGEGGRLYVSLPNEGRIVSLKLDGGLYKVQNTFVEGYPSAHGMHFHNGWLWFTQTNGVHRAQDTNGDGKADRVVTVLDAQDLPMTGGHWWRSILVDDTHFWTSVGDPGNITDQRETDREKIWRFALDGTQKTLWCGGIRNTEKLRFRPNTKEICGLDHGSDWFGKPLGESEGRQPITDQIPPEEFNHYRQGEFYGHPFIVGNALPRIEFQDREDIIKLAELNVAPAWEFGAHWAGNGFTFYTGDAFGDDHKGDAFCAFHGSWNSSVRVGYRVERLMFDEVTGKPYGSLMIVETLSPDGRVLGRPVDCAQAPDGTVLFSDDHSNRIYRISPSE